MKKILTEMDRLPRTFNEAFNWHLDNELLTLAEVERYSGVSRGALNKLKFDPTAQTAAERAIAIAAVYGKTLDAFMQLNEPDLPSGSADFLRIFSGMSEDQRQSIIQLANSFASKAKTEPETN